MATSVEAGRIGKARIDVGSSGPEANPLRPDELQQRVPDALWRGWSGVTRRGLRVVLLLLSDALAAGAAALLVLVLAGAMGAGAPAATLVFYSVVLVALGLAAADAYTEFGYRKSPARIMAAVGGAASLALIHGALVPDSLLASIASPWTIVYFGAATIAIFAGRALIEFGLQSAYQRGWGQRRVLVIGTGRETARVMRLIRLQGGADIRMVGRLALARNTANPMESVLRDLEKELRTSGAGEVVFAGSGTSLEHFETLVQRCFEIGVPVSLAPHILHRIGARLELSRTRVGAVLRLQPVGMGLSRLAVKRSMDVALSALCIVLLFPLLAVIAVLIRLDSPGPVLFRQTRTGLGGRPFRMYKFRTMVDDADSIKPLLGHLNESGDPRLFKIRHDPRVTRIGRLLRRTSLDELPQLINVLRGEMSLIGPRPFFPSDLVHYEEHHFDRLSVLPGITGLWQVKGRSAVLDFEEVIRLDRQYIDEWSVWLDLKILGWTFPAVMKRTGAY
jgi:exopolysaccharide biosynthesis polyprenyl glycosylphosphotransferase